MATDFGSLGPADRTGGRTSPPAGDQGADTSAVRVWLGRGLLSVLAVLLGWQVITRSFAAYLAEHAPRAALVLAPGDAVALLQVAENALAPELAAKFAPPAAEPGSSALPSAVAKNSKSPATPQAAYTPDQTVLALARDHAERALLAHPLSAKAVRVLGQVAELGGDPAQATAWHGLATSRSLFETASVYHTMLTSFGAREHARTLDLAEALLRTRPDLREAAMPVLGALAENPETSLLLSERLRTGPPWRTAFLQDLPRFVTDARTPLKLLLTLKETPHPPTLAELEGYQTFLISRNLAELAYYTWLQFLPPDQLAAATLLFNGTLERPVNVGAFNWIVRQGSGTSIAVLPRPDDGSRRALNIEFGAGRVELGEVGQRTMLQPGTYKLTGEYQGTILGRRGLQWLVVCAGKSTSRLAESPPILGTQVKWRAFEMTLTVPPSDCASQQVKLLHDWRSESERFISGNIWFADFKIERQ